MINFKKGNIFTTECDVIVNTVNCSGVMGAGIAYEFRLRYPIMFERYQTLCKHKKLTIGRLWIYSLSDNEKFQEKYTRILNFPTKNFWKFPSKIEYLEQGLQKFVDTYQDKGISSVAFPLLGASKGGIEKSQSIEVMEKYLGGLDIHIEIWDYDPNAMDDVFEDFKQKFMSLTDDEIKEKSSLRGQYIKKIKEALKNNNIKNMNGLLNVPGIGDVTLEKSFRFIKTYNKQIVINDQITLFE